MGTEILSISWCRLTRDFPPTCSLFLTLECRMLSPKGHEVFSQPADNTTCLNSTALTPYRKKKSHCKGGGKTTPHIPGEDLVAPQVRIASGYQKKVSALTRLKTNSLANTFFMAKIIFLGGQTRTFKIFLKKNVFL